MAYYRLYFFCGRSGRIEQCREFELADDRAAIAQAEAWRTGGAMELWSGARKVMAWASAAEAGWAGPGAGSRLRRA